MPIVNSTLMDNKKASGIVPQQKTLPMAIAEAEKQNCEVKKIFVSFDPQGEVVMAESDQFVKFNDLNNSVINNNNVVNNNNVNNGRTVVKKKDKKKSVKPKAQNNLSTQTENIKIETNSSISHCNNNNSAQIQPDSTTSSNSLDQNYLLDFEELQKIGDKLQAEECVKCHPNELALLNDSSWLDDFPFYTDHKPVENHVTFQNQNHVQPQQTHGFLQNSNIIEHNQNILQSNQNYQMNTNNSLQMQHDNSNSMISQHHHQQHQQQNIMFETNHQNMSQISMIHNSNQQLQQTQQSNLQDMNMDQTMNEFFDNGTLFDVAFNDNHQFISKNNNFVSQHCHYAANTNFNSRNSNNFDPSQTDFLMDYPMDDYDFRSNNNCSILN